MKTWARKRFGVEVGYHEGKRGAAANSAALKDAQDYANYRGVPMDRLFRLLDLEYEFHQYTLRLLHRWDRFKVARYMDKRGFSGQFGSGQFTPNAIASMTSHRKGFSGEVGIDLQDVRPEDFLKIWMQGPEYMKFYGQIPVELKDFFDSIYTSSREYEYLIIGRKHRYDRFI